MTKLDTNAIKARFAQTADFEQLRTQFTPERLARFQAVVDGRQRGLRLFMEQVIDKHNLGAITRTADGFGIQHIHYTSDEAFDPTFDGFLSSSTANQWVDYHQSPTTARALDALHDDGYQLVATLPHDDAQSLYAVDWTRYDKLAVLIGNEHRGLSDTARDYADIAITIPMRGMIHSYNVSVATAIVLAEITRQRDASDTDFGLTETEALALLESFVRRAY